MAATFAPGTDGGDALDRLLSAEPPLFLSPSSELSACSRSASCHLFSSLVPHCPKPPFDSLFTDEGFDAEQIWSQIDLLSRPILSSLRREVKRLERLAPPVSEAEVKVRGREGAKKEAKEDGRYEKGMEEEVEGMDYDDDDVDDHDDEEKEDEKERVNDELKKVDIQRIEVEDRFFKLKELEDYLEDDEAREYGYHRKERRVKRKEGEDYDNDNDEDSEDDKDEDEDNAEFEDLDSGDEGAEDIRYEDFFGGKKDKVNKFKGAMKEIEGEFETKDLLSDEEKGEDIDAQNGGTLSTHEKELLKLRSEIQEMEKANLEPKMWTMQGEVTAAKRPKNSALEVDLDFERNVRPPPVITEEVTASIEDLIKKRIVEGHFDDVQRAPDLPSKAPKEYKEMDETKSKKGLAEIYEEEYALKTGLATTPLSSSHQKMEEASLLFKNLCLKLDALAHFHFAPKPIIEEMSIQANIPALAIEEIAPVAVSDAAMLAPEEIFQGKGDIKEEAELTKTDRRRRRANKKRRFKGKNEVKKV